MLCCACFPFQGKEATGKLESGKAAEADDNPNMRAGRKNGKRREKDRRAVNSDLSGTGSMDDEMVRLDNDSGVHEEALASRDLKGFLDLKTPRDIEDRGVSTLLLLSESGFIKHIQQNITPGGVSEGGVGLPASPQTDFISAIRGPSDLALRTGLAPRTITQVCRAIGRCIDRVLYPLLERGIDAPLHEARSTGDVPLTASDLTKRCRQQLQQESWVAEVLGTHDAWWSGAALLAQCVRAGLLALGWLSGAFPADPHHPAGPFTAPLSATTLYVSSVSACVSLVEFASLAHPSEDSAELSSFFSLLGVLPVAQAPSPTCGASPTAEGAGGGAGGGVGGGSAAASSLHWLKGLPFYALDASAKGHLFHFSAAIASSGLPGLGVGAGGGGSGGDVLEGLMESARRLGLLGAKGGGVAPGAGCRRVEVGQGAEAAAAAAAPLAEGCRQQQQRQHPLRPEGIFASPASAPYPMDSAVSSRTSFEGHDEVCPVDRQSDAPAGPLSPAAAPPQGGGQQQQEPITAPRTIAATKSVRQLFELLAYELTSSWGLRKQVGVARRPCPAAAAEGGGGGGGGEPSSSSSSSSSVRQPAGGRGPEEVTLATEPWATLQEGSAHVLITYPTAAVEAAVPQVQEGCRLTFVNLLEHHQHEHFVVDDALDLVVVGFGEAEFLNVDGVSCTQLRVKCNKVSGVTASRIGFAVSQPATPLFQREHGGAAWFNCSIPELRAERPAFGTTPFAPPDDPTPETLAARAQWVEKFSTTGWLLGQAMANGVSLPIDLPAVLFTILKSWPSFQPREEYLLSFGSLSRAALQSVKSLPAEDLEKIASMQGLPAGTSHTAYLEHLCEEILVASVRLQISAFVEGFQATGIHSTVLFRNASAEELRAIACGRCDGASDFFLKYEFRVAEDEVFRRYPHNEVFLQILWDLMNDGLDAPHGGPGKRDIRNKRRVLKFATGRRMLPPIPQQEEFRLSCDALGEGLCADAYGELLQRFPRSHTCDNTLEFPNYAEAVIFSPGSPWYTITSRSARDPITEEDKQSAWSVLSAAPAEVIESLRQSIIRVSLSKLLQATQETEYHELDSV